MIVRNSQIAKHPLQNTRGAPSRNMETYLRCSSTQITMKHPAAPGNSPKNKPQKSPSQTGKHAGEFSKLTTFLAASIHNHVPSIVTSHTTSSLLGFTSVFAKLELLCLIFYPRRCNGSRWFRTICGLCDVMVLTNWGDYYSLWRIWGRCSFSLIRDLAINLASKRSSPFTNSSSLGPWERWCRR